MWKPGVYLRAFCYHGGMDAFHSFLAKVSENILNPIITLVALAAFAYFAYGVMKFIRNAENDEKRGEGKMHMLWGIVGLAIVFGASAIINLLKGVVQ